MSAKVDNAAAQDGFQICHYISAFTADESWAIVQQRMDQTGGWARYYHWSGDNLETFIREPHAAVCDRPAAQVLNMVAGESAKA